MGITETTRTRRKTLPLVAAVLAPLTFVTACGGSAGSAEEGPVTLRMTVWTADEGHLQLLEDIAKEYRRSHPDIAEIKFDSLPRETYTTALTTQIAGGDAPDLAWILESSAPDFINSGALAPLKEKIQDEQDLVPTATKLWQKDGELYAYPFSTSPFGVFVNTDVIKDAGQKTPAELIKDGKWNWDNAMKVNAAVAEGDKAGLSIPDFEYKDWDNLATIWGGWDAEPWSDDGKTCGFNSPDMLDAMTFFHDAAFKSKATPQPGVVVDFFAGDAAMAIAQMSRSAQLKDATFGWDLVPLPSGPKGDYAVIGQAGIGVMKKSPNADAATDFLSFMTSPANSAKLGQFFPPARSAQLNAGTLAKSNPLLKPEQVQSVVIDGISKGIVKPQHTGMDELKQTVRAALDPLWKPNADVKAVLGGVCAKIQPMLGS
ncbi:ABC transporter substrate-binding protein [Streptomyces sp. NPDC098781]|uniref:ABC transporter substrate-binding protein n=1 Tax=Streptomyces sp. NPDC098781 TaxID=3366097 RepID=UPI0037F9C32E